MSDFRSMERVCWPTMQSSTTCVLCLAPLTRSTDSAEHILLQALGGRRQVRGFLCKVCNSRAGAEWDAALVKQLAHIALMHGVDRQRAGDLPPVRVKRLGGDELILHADGLMAPAAPSYRETPTDRGKSIQITARTRAEARGMVQGIARKHPDVDVAAALADMTMSTSINEDLLQLQIRVGGPLAGRSLVKTALAMAHWAGIRHEDCTSIGRYLCGDDADPPYRPFYERNIVDRRPADHLLNCVAIDADPRTRLALAYVEYFGAAKFVVLLSDDYSGPGCHHVYAINPGTGAEVAVDVDLRLEPAELQRVVAGESYSLKGYEAAVNTMMPILLRRAESRAFESTVHAAFTHAAEQMGLREGDAISESQVPEFSRLVARYMAPYMIGLQRRNAQRAGGANLSGAVRPIGEGVDKAND